MNEFKAWSNETLGNKVVEALNKNNFTACYVKTRQDACDLILSMIPPEATVGVGGSYTVGELGVLPKLEEKGNTLFNHGKPGLTPEEALNLRRAQLTCDVFLTGTNAVTLDGKLVNVDGNGNRTAAMMFGPKQVIVVTGVNKIVRDVAEAEKRIELVAAPINNKRLNRPNPCTITGMCMDCQGPSRICNITTILRKRSPFTPTSVIIVGEELGF